VYESAAKAILDSEPCCDLCRSVEEVGWHATGWLCLSCWLTLGRIAVWSKLKR
jgi:hypothetical protein